MRNLSFIMVFILGLLLPGHSARAEPLLVFAASSLSGALDEVNEAFDGPTPRVAYAASSTLARQMLQGAPAEVFISANPAWMDFLQDRNAIDPTTRMDLLSNRLVIVSQAGLGKGLNALTELPAKLENARIALALTQAVPAGIYARSAFEAAGIWDAISHRTAETDNVRAALKLVIRGETPYGVVYATDAASTDIVEVSLEVDPNLHEPILYPVALGVTASSGARAYLEFLKSQNAAAIFAAHGFGLVNR